MADDDDKQNKTEEPTEQKLKKAREKGDVASSREVGNLTAVLSLFAIAGFLLPAVAVPLVGVLRRIFESAGQVIIGEGGTGLADVSVVTWALSRGVGLTMAPIMVMMVTAAIVGVLLQGETVVALERIKPKLSKISPLAGLKKMFSAASLVEFAKSVVKVLVVGAIALTVAYSAVTQVAEVQGLVPELLPDFARRHAMKMLVITLVLVAVVAVVDVIWKRFDWRRKQRMSVQDIRDEVKDTEGDPQMRGKRAALRRERAQQRITTAVPRATVVLTNPTHFAIALKYEAGLDEAPICVAKGADLMARQIRKIARESEVPLVENKPLARALYAVAEVDKEIPVEHWEAVAAIIGYVMDMNRNIRRTPPEGSSLRIED